MLLFQQNSACDLSGSLKCAARSIWLMRLGFARIEMRSSHVVETGSARRWAVHVEKSRAGTPDIARRRAQRCN